MNKSLEMIEYEQIIYKLEELAITEEAKEQIRGLRPFRKETELRKHLRDTSQAKALLEQLGTPPMPRMEHTKNYVEKAEAGDMLLPEQLERVASFLTGVRRLKAYLDKGKEKQISLAFYSENLSLLLELADEISRCIRGNEVEDNASAKLRECRRQSVILEEKAAAKAEQVLKANKGIAAETFVVKRNGKLCIPIKKEYRGKVAGSVLDKSSTGATLFIEPAAVAKIQEELEGCRLEEDEEIRRILYTLSDQVAEHKAEIEENVRVTAMLDYVFAKGKLSVDMQATEPAINLDGYIRLKEARHPLLNQESCVPLNFEIGRGIRGVIITGPNTGGKTVSIKTVALMNVMACSGLHVPCKEADIAMRSQILCDIGDGQKIADNLSTFSAHMTNVLDILKRVNQDSLVIMDELGSGTDPAEGMGIAVAVLEQLRLSQALFLVTTHYPEVKEYAEGKEEIQNARMGFDRESLKPLYRLELGQAGESCALYIAKKLGLPNEMLTRAAREAYGEQAPGVIKELDADKADGGLKKVSAPKVEAKPVYKNNPNLHPLFHRGDSVTVLPENKIAIVVVPADTHGNVLVQLRKEKITVNQKRLKLKVAAEELYPEDYDFSILFDTVENRKARHKMGKGHQEDLEVILEDYKL